MNPLIFAAVLSLPPSLPDDNVLCEIEGGCRLITIRALHTYTRAIWEREMEIRMLSERIRQLEQGIERCQSGRNG
jgi:hypothetical protein